MDSGRLENALDEVHEDGRFTGGRCKESRSTVAFAASTGSRQWTLDRAYWTLEDHWHGGAEEGRIERLRGHLFPAISKRRRTAPKVFFAAQRVHMD